MQTFNRDALKASQFWERHLQSIHLKATTARIEKRYEFQLDQAIGEQFQKVTKQDEMLELTVLATCLNLAQYYVTKETSSIAMPTDGINNNPSTLLKIDVGHAEAVKSVLSLIRKEMMQALQYNTYYKNTLFKIHGSTTATGLYGIQTKQTLLHSNLDAEFILTYHGRDSTTGTMGFEVIYNESHFDDNYVKGFSQLIALLLQTALEQVNWTIQAVNKHVHELIENQIHRKETPIAVFISECGYLLPDGIRGQIYTPNLDVFTKRFGCGRTFQAATYNEQIGLVELHAFGRMRADDSVEYAEEVLLPDKVVTSIGQIELEKEISKLIAEMLGLADIDYEENFFEIGMTSLLLFELCDLIKTHMKMDVKPIDTMLYPTIRSLAEYISTINKKEQDVSIKEIATSTTRNHRIRRKVVRR